MRFDATTPLLSGDTPALVIGLMSGTSADGVDAACCRLSHPPGGALAWEVLATASHPYRKGLGDMLRSPERLVVPELAALHVEIGLAFGEAAHATAREAGISLADVALIGSHGQTVWHDPRGARGGIPTTLQIGSPAAIAEQTGCAVWADFRSADVAAGGEGAPFVPYADWLLFTDPVRWTVCLNLGGIANVTLLPPGATAADVIAFDTGPGNMVLDYLAQKLLGTTHDVGGALAARGRVDAGRLATALEDPYFERPAPKSTGREAFGAAFVERHFSPLEALAPDGVTERFATAAALTIETVARAIEGGAGAPFVPDSAEVLVGGGGRRNHVLMEGLAGRCAPRRVIPVDERGLDGDAKEAIAFAILAYESALGRAVNLPSATGARHPARCGALTFPPPAGPHHG